MTRTGAKCVCDVRPVMTDGHMILPTKARHCVNFSLSPGSPFFSGPRSAPGLPGMFEVVEMFYSSTMFSANPV